MDTHQELEDQLRRLLTGLADQEIKKGLEFRYDGGRLFATDVATLALPAVLCIAQDMALRLGMGGIGYQFEFCEPNPVFPLRAEPMPDGVPRRFFEVAPFVMEVFESKVLEHRLDLASLYEAAARLLSPGFSLQAKDDTKPAPVAAPRKAPESLGLER